MTRFGITAQDYDRILEKQQGVCAICQSTCKSGRELSIDHDHITGEVRGLLCNKCNNGIGCFSDNFQTMEAASRYLITSYINQKWEKEDAA